MTRSFVLLGAMDSFARGLKNAAKLIEDGTLDSLVKVSLKLLSLFCLEKIEFFVVTNVTRYFATSPHLCNANSLICRKAHCCI